MVPEELISRTQFQSDVFCCLSEDETVGCFSVPQAEADCIVLFAVCVLYPFKRKTMVGGEKEEIASSPENNNEVCQGKDTLWVTRYSDRRKVSQQRVGKLEGSREKGADNQNVRRNRRETESLLQLSAELGRFVHRLILCLCSFLITLNYLSWIRWVS